MTVLLAQKQYLNFDVFVRPPRWPFFIWDGLVAINLNRIPLYSALAVTLNEKPIRWLKIDEAFHLKTEKIISIRCRHCGLPEHKSSTRRCNSRADGHALIAQFTSPVTNKHGDPATLTFGDMERNAAARGTSGLIPMEILQKIEEHQSPSRTKLEAWPYEHDHFAVTVVAGRGAFIPDTNLAKQRAVAMKQVSA